MQKLTDLPRIETECLECGRPWGLFGPWQPIETALKDECILVWSDKDGVNKCYYEEQEGEHRWIIYMSDDDQSCGSIVYPTHWMPLPEGPK